MLAEEDILAVEVGEDFVLAVWGVMMGARVSLTVGGWKVQKAAASSAELNVLRSSRTK